MNVHADPEALRALARRTRELCDDAGRGRDTVLRELVFLRERWNDARYAEAYERLVPTMDRVRAGLDALDSASARLDRLAAALDVYLRAGATASADARSAAAIAGRDRRGPVSLALLRTSTIEWTSPDFGIEFYRATDKGHAGDGYLALARGLPAVRRSVERGDAASLPPGSAARRCWEAFYGSDPIRIEKRAGRLDVIDGRHRLFACLALDIEPIADLVDLD